jgi:hypothetical protein
MWWICDGAPKATSQEARTVPGTDQPEVRNTDGGIAWTMFRVAVSGRREQEASFVTVVVWRDQAEHAAQSRRRAAGSWSWAGSSSAPGPPRTAAPVIVEVVVDELGSSLRWATTTTTRTTRSREQ